MGIDIIPAKPPKGASAIQGNFLSPAVQEEVKQFLRDPKRGRPRSQKFFVGDEAESDEVNGLTEAELEEVERGYIDIERHASVDDPHADPALEGREDGGWRRLQKGPVPEDGRMVDVVLSDMSDPWPQTSGYHIRSLSAPYSRMMNTSGISFRDHAGSMVSFSLFHGRYVVYEASHSIPGWSCRCFLCTEDGRCWSIDRRPC